MDEESMVIGPYRVVGTLGHGGMSVVYRAEHVLSGSAVALKTVPTSSQNLLAGLRREIHTLTRIHHRGVVQIVAQGVQLGRPWYAMELLEGATFRAYLQRLWANHGPPRSAETQSNISTADFLDIPDTVDLSRSRRSPAAPVQTDLPKPRAAAGALVPTLSILWKICATVAYLHGEGVINCDLKPENVLVVPGRGPVLIDFGLTSRFGGPGGREILDPARGISGTLVYMSPEQIRHDFVDARADLYALGCIMYECMTGWPPFTGSNKEVLAKHLGVDPVPPSELVSHLPRELEALILKLLKKRLHDRMGYADDAALAIRDMIGDSGELTHYPTPRPYLYRPQFSGRQKSLDRVMSRFPTAAGQPGALVLISGESGSGKTRFAMEITRKARRPSLRTVTSDCTPPSSSLVSNMTNAPLYAIRPLLQHIADRCQEAGRDFSDLVLGPRGPILALYEPAFLNIPGQDVQPAPLRLTSTAAHRQLFKALVETITSLCALEPLLLVIDDLQWADELTLAFVRHLASAKDTCPFFVLLATFRSENAALIPGEADDSGQVLRVALETMGFDSVRSIVSDMLALSSPPPEGSVKFLTRMSGGNPFFVSEYLRAGVEAGIIHRRQFQGWEIADFGDAASADAYEALPLPRSLQELISHRLRSLSTSARALVELAAVFGREVDSALLLNVLSIPEAQFSTVFDDLTGRQILESTRTSSVRFVHDKLREVVYSEIPGDEARDLHRRAGLALEAAHEESDKAGLQWAVLGHHFSLARLPDRAAKYLGKAGDQARAANANADALQHYLRAIANVEEVLLDASRDPQEWGLFYSQLHEAVADLLALSGKGDAAQQRYGTALDRLPAELGLARARVLRKMGKAFENQHRHEESLGVYQLAELAMGREPHHEEADAWRAEWVQLRSQQVFSNYWLARVPELERLVAELTERVPPSGNSRDLARLHQAEMHLCFRRERYLISAAGVEHARAALNARLSAGDLAELPLAHFNFAFSLYLNQRFDSADWELRSALSAADRAGDVAHQARCLTYLTALARRQQRVDDVRVRVGRSQAVAESADMRDYIAAGHAHQAWLAIRDGNLIRAEEEAALALQIWGSLKYVFPFQWMALFPMMMVKFVQDDLVAAATCVAATLKEPQQRLPSPVVALLEEAMQAFEENAFGRLRDTLHHGLNTFQQHGFL